jgi:hypothetical protein
VDEMGPPEGADPAPCLLPGPTASDLLRSAGLNLLISGLFLLAMAPSPFLPGSIRGDLVLVAVIGVLTFGARALRAAVRSARVEGQEKKAGYPTLQGRKYQRYWQLDPRTGSVVRRPRHR